MATDRAQAAAMGAVWMTEVPIALPRFIGVMEVLGVLGLILPAATRIMPHLTVWAAAGATAPITAAAVRAPPSIRDWKARFMKMSPWKIPTDGVVDPWP